MSKKQNKRPNTTNLSQFGLLDFSEPVEDDDISLGSDDDPDLEAELAAISGGASSRRKPNKPKSAPAINLDAMIAESLKDIPSDEDVSGDDDDPDLLSELNELTIEDSDEPPKLPARSSRPAPPRPGGENPIVKLLQERITMYQTAEKNAIAKGESSRARRFNRGLKTLNDMLKQAKAGRPVKEEDIPPIVATGNVSTPQPTTTVEEPSSLLEPSEPPHLPPAEEEPPLPPPRAHSISPPEVPATPVSQPTELDSGLQLIMRRKEEFKAAALTHKQTDKQLALELLKVAKQFDIVLDAYKSGQEMDLNELPTVEVIVEGFKIQEKQKTPTQDNAESQPLAPTETSGLITASSLLEALKQHMAYYKEQESKASETGNSAKQRRMSRIVKQFAQNIAQVSAGRNPDIADLPTPPGHAPLATYLGNKPTSSSSPAVGPSRTAPTVPAASLANKQLAVLLKRQKEFKEAAITAKKNGDIALAKEYLRSAKGFDSVIEAAREGHKVDMSSLPHSPRNKVQSEVEDTFDVVSPEDCDPLGDDVLTTLHQQLSTQLNICTTNRDHYRAMGNIAESNKFDQMLYTVQQDLNVIVIAKRLNKEPPKFHYENRQFTIVKCNTDLNENDLELTIVRGIAYNVPNPKEVDTYVKFEFPYSATEEPIYDKTNLVKDTNSPVYNEVFPLTIARGSRRCLRVFKRHGVKFEVYSKGGWFSKDSLLGTAVVKLAPLETCVTIHEAYPLMDGRRPAGGSLEVKLRVRTPLTQPHVERLTHRWLVLDYD